MFAIVIKTKCTLGHVWEEGGGRAQEKCYGPLLGMGESLPVILRPMLSSSSSKEMRRNYNESTGDLTR